MAGDVRGNLVRVQLATETTYKTAGTDGNLLYFTQCSVVPERQRNQSATLSGRRGQARSSAAAKNVTGQLAVELSPHSIGILLKHLIGTPTTTGASAPYSHVFVPAISGSTALPVAFTLEEDYGSVMSSTARYLQMLGCRIADGSFSFTANGIPTASFNVVGADWLQSAASIDATPTDNGHTGFQASELAVTINTGSAKSICVNSITLNWSNDLDTDKHCVSGGGVRDGLPEGFVIIGGQIDAFFDHEDVINQALAGTDTDLQITLTKGDGLGTAGNEKLTIALGDIVFAETGPRLTGPRGVRVQMDFTAHCSGTSEIDATFTLLNAIASYT